MIMVRMSRTAANPFRSDLPTTETSTNRSRCEFGYHFCASTLVKFSVRGFVPANWQVFDPVVDLGFEPCRSAAEIARRRKLSCKHPRPNCWEGATDAFENFGLGQQNFGF